MEEPFSSGYFATLLIADHIQKASRGAKHKKCFIRPIQPDASVDGHGAESCHEAVEQTGQCVAFPEHFQHRITHGLISLHGQRIDTLRMNHQPIPARTTPAIRTPYFSIFFQS